MQVPKRRSDLFRKVDDGPIYLTQEGARQLQARRLHLKKILPELIRETQRAAAFGDRSENDEYKHAKGSLRRANYEILRIEDQLKRVAIIKIGQNESGKIGLGSTVVLETKNRAQKTFQIVGPDETNPEKGRISHRSPLGIALVGRKQGEVVEIKTNNGSQAYKIIKVQ